ncbi:MAG: hypothetical protein JHC40_09570 [Burkholderiales bacterium]|jgi:hypothetical protein|nr:hypothetical protein [Burkholderiales bacterium]
MQMNRAIVGTGTLLAAGGLAAHDSHGVSGPHWHASDLFGLLLVGVVLAGPVEWRGRK